MERESYTSDLDAQIHGESHFRKNPWDIYKLYLDEYGNLNFSGSISTPYMSHSLGRAYANGALDGVLNDTYESREKIGLVGDSTKATMLGHARWLGNQIASEQLSPCVRYNTGIEYRDRNILSKEYNSKMTRTVDRETGFITVNWYYPFKQADMNQAFTDGVNEWSAKYNTPELMQARVDEFKAAALKEQLELERKRKRERIANWVVNSIFAGTMVAIVALAVSLHT
jgi:hypothetical protein